MQIVSQDRSLSMPYNGARLRMKDGYTTQVIALTPNSSGVVIAEYDDYEKAKQILEEITRNNESRTRRWVYYMPAK